MLLDELAVPRLRDRSEAAMHALVDQYHGRIYRYVLGLVDNPQVAADLTQDTFVQAYGALHRLADESNVSAWLFRIATNVVRKHERRGRLIGWFSLELFTGGRPGPEDQVIERSLVAQALDELPADYKTCLLLDVWAGLSCAEIALAVGKSEQAVRTILVRARRRFRTAYTAATSDGEE